MQPAAEFIVVGRATKTGNRTKLGAAVKSRSDILNSFVHHQGLEIFCGEMEIFIPRPQPHSHFSSQRFVLHQHN